MKQYKVQELVGNTKKLPHTEKLFYETLINFRKLPECAQLFLPLQLQAHFKCRRKHHCSHCEKSDLKENNDLKRQCSRDEKEMQSYAEWKYFMTWMKLSSVKNFRRLRRSTVYILPIGPFPEGILCSLVSPQMTFLQSLTTFGEAFFPGLCFKVLPEIEFKEIGCNTRIHKKTGQLQILLPGELTLLSLNPNVKNLHTGNCRLRTPRLSQVLLCKFLPQYGNKSKHCCYNIFSNFYDIQTWAKVYVRYC